MLPALLALLQRPRKLSGVLLPAADCAVRISPGIASLLLGLPVTLPLVAFIAFRPRRSVTTR